MILLDNLQYLIPTGNENEYMCDKKWILDDFAVALNFKEGLESLEATLVKINIKVELNKNDIGLGQVNNTADSIKSVRSSIYAEKDKNGNSIDEYYFTKYDSTLMQVEIDKLNEKYVSTNNTLADLRTEIINNAHFY